ncbi:MAG TPA: glycosyl transferase family 1 [Chryseobacterium sp.]|nr:glycosyl transferase family 1 [Chryseobacterium sp.]
MLGKIEYYWSKILKKIRLRALVNVEIHSTSKVCSGSQLVNVKMGKYSDIGYDCIILNTDIGAFCSFGANIIIGGAPHTIDWVSTSPVFNKNKDHLPKKFALHDFSLEGHTSIGNDVWIANNVLIKTGVTVGDGAVIGMGSVVTKDVGPYEIWAGNPARFIKKRFDDESIKAMLAIKWWKWDDRKIEENGFLFNDVKKFIETHQNK